MVLLPGQTRLEQAIEFLEMELYAGLPIAAEHVVWGARLDGISARTLRRAKKRLGVVSRKEGWHGEWVWRLPDGHPSLMFPGSP
jgi:hypothetical protein